MSTFTSLRELEKARNKKPDRSYSVGASKCFQYFIVFIWYVLCTLIGVIIQRLAICRERMESRWSIYVDYYDFNAYHSSPIEHRGLYGILCMWSRAHLYTEIAFTRRTNKWDRQGIAQQRIHFQSDPGDGISRSNTSKHIIDRCARIDNVDCGKIRKSICISSSLKNELSALCLCTLSYNIISSTSH